ncbi:hypothetical protein LOTGIDRAFT_161833 [Lottia gigantea]|uniref:SUEL-type lectin domain-containing protein n=1 Tax=Lottia gigantea TaxID=225164 RepID=V4ADR7_LOTGI|nr:hypothetical protein LOTGIDRAFT_161833 [Lottia gigantea]ESO93270.1 hypothetical protein LOTGIDRAFT_161833 [Lottia gigantea]
MGYTEARQNIYASACNNNYLNLQCPRNQRIAIKRLFYGVNTAKRCKNRKLGDCCRATQNDCREFDDTVYPKLNNRCSGYEKCSIIVESVPIRSTGCQTDRSYTDYMTVIYDCVAIEDIASFCSDDIKRGKVLYLANEEYPRSISTRQSSCQCVAATEFSNGINLFSIDVLIARAEFGDRKCSRSITITDKHAFEKELTCGHSGWFGYRTVYSRTVNNVTLELHNGNNEGTAFVWLEVKATNSNDYVQIHCGESLHRLLVGSHESGERRTEDEVIIKTSSTTSGAGINIGESASAYGPNSLSSDMAAIVGGIVVAAFFIFTIVIVAIAVHCRRIRKERNKPMKVELYPAIPPSQLETSSYRHFDYDDDHYCSISRSPMKVSSFSDCPTGNQTFRESQPPAIVTDHDTTNMKSGDYIENQALIHHTELPQRDYMSIDDKEMNGHKTLPAQHRSSSISNPFPTKLPPNKRSKSVTFSQPVAKVTPMNSESEESVPDHPASKISLTYINPDDDYYEFPPPPPLESLEIKQDENSVQPPADIQDLYAVVNKPKKVVPIDDDKPYDNVTVAPYITANDYDKSFKSTNYKIQVNGMGTLEHQKVETGV